MLRESTKKEEKGEREREREREKREREKICIEREREREREYNVPKSCIHLRRPWTGKEKRKKKNEIFFSRV
jgi:hypothetical protein